MVGLLCLLGVAQAVDVADPVSRAVEEMRQGGWPQAVGTLSRASVQYPDDPAVWVLLAWCWNELGDPVQARAALHPLLLMGTLSPELHRELGVSYQLEGRYEQALSQLKHIDPKDGRGLIARAQVKAALGDRDGAAADLDLATQDSAWRLSAVKEKARVDSVLGLVPQDLSLRAQAGLAFVSQPAYVRDTRGVESSDGLLSLAVDGRYALLQGERADLDLTFGLGQDIHFRNGFLHPTSLDVGAELTGAMRRGYATFAPELRHIRWPDAPLLTGLSLPFEYRIPRASGPELIQRGGLELLLHHGQVDSTQRYSGAYGRWGYGVGWGTPWADVEAVGLVDLALTWGKTRRAVAMGGELRASAPLPKDLSVDAWWRVLGGVHPWKEALPDARRVELMHQAGARVDWPTLPGQAVRVGYELDTRQSTVPDLYSYGRHLVSAAYVAEL